MRNSIAVRYMTSKQTFVVTKFRNKTFEKRLQINFVISVSNNFDCTLHLNIRIHSMMKIELISGGNC
jgi:hypothetical protein